MQRKLTRGEIAQVEQAKATVATLPHEMCNEETVAVMQYFYHALRHSTTDGNPYVEPQPEIGDGYRLATESDVGRRDLEYFSNLKGNGWFARPVHGKPLESSYHYRVPVDRIPTDEDAKQRPTVMVRDNDKESWQARRLLAVTGCLDKFITSSSSGVACFWMQARFPYPGELD